MKLGAILPGSSQSDQLGQFLSQIVRLKKTWYDEEWIIVFSENSEGTVFVFQANKD